jgi:peptide/nickel transport system substrate-binding protein
MCTKNSERKGGSYTEQVRIEKQLLKGTKSTCDKFFKEEENVKNLKKLLVLGLAFAMTLSLTACGGSSSSSGSAASEEKTITFGADGEPTSLNPDDANGKGATFIDKCVYETLWRFDNDGNQIMLLATDAEWTDDLELTITLRDGVTFSNGDEFDAEDVKASLELLMQSVSKSSRFSMIDMDKSTFEGNKVVLELTSYSPTLIENMGGSGLYIYDADWISESGDMTSEMVGTGPYVLDNWSRGNVLTLKKNDNYWGDEPYYDTINVKFYSDETTRMMAFEDGEVDFIYLTSNENIERIKNGEVENAEVGSYASQNVTVFNFDRINTDKFDDIRVREAIAEAIDVDTMVSTICGDSCQVADSVLSPVSWGYESQEAYTYDPEHAKELLAEAGYDESNPLSFTFTYMASGFNDDLAEAIQAYLAEVGINMEVNGMEAASFIGEMLGGGIEASFGGFIGSVDPAGCLNAFEPVEGNNATCGRFGEDEEGQEMLSLLYDVNYSTASQDERAERYHELQEMIHDNYVNVPLTVSTVSYAYHTDITGIEESLDSEQAIGYYGLAAASDASGDQ